MNWRFVNALFQFNASLIIALNLYSNFVRESHPSDLVFYPYIYLTPAMALPAHYVIFYCAVFSGGKTALLLTPGTGVCKPADGKPAARYRQMAAAVDEAAQTNPTVSPFDPAVRDDAAAPLRFGRCLRRSMALGFRSYL